MLPSATEILAALGLTESIVARSHECDYPPEIRARPMITEPKFSPFGSSAEIHDRVTRLLQSTLGVYRIDLEALEELQPTHIVTQAQCDVCAVSLAEVEAAVKSLVNSHPTVISLQPHHLEDVWADITRVAEQTGQDAQPVLTALQARIDRCTAPLQDLATEQRPTVACLEWLDPLMAAGNWVPELVERAGGRCLIGTSGQHSPWLGWDALMKADPDLIVAMPCGFNLARTRRETEKLSEHPGWQKLRAVKTGQVYLTDGNAYFNRPGPRLVDSLEILAEIFHPDRCAFGHCGQGWETLTQPA